MENDYEVSKKEDSDSKPKSPITLLDPKECLVKTGRGTMRLTAPEPMRRILRSLEPQNHSEDYQEPDTNNRYQV